MLRKTVWGLMSATSLLVFVGCCASERQASYPPTPVPAPAPCNHCANSGPLPPRFTPAPAPTPSNYYTPPTYTPPAYTPPTYTPPPTSGTYVPPSVRLAPPEAVTQEPPRSEPPRETAKLSPPQTIEPPPASIPNATTPLVKNEPPPNPTPPLPVDIPSFTLVKPRVATGLQPFPDGITWLQTAGYRTVLHIRPPNDRSTIAKDTFEKHQLTYVSLEVGPNNLTKETVDRFNKLVTDEEQLPVFVYDLDSSLAGTLWYLHFRTVGGLTEEKARLEAERLGFRSDKDETARSLWNAAQTYLQNGSR